MEVIVFIILEIFFTTHTVLKIGEYSRIFPSFSWGTFSHVLCLEQNSQSCDVFRPIAHEQKYLMDYYLQYPVQIKETLS